MVKSARTPLRLVRMVRRCLRFVRRAFRLSEITELTSEQGRITARIIRIASYTVTKTVNI